MVDESNVLNLYLIKARDFFLGFIVGAIWMYLLPFMIRWLL